MRFVQIDQKILRSSMLVLILQLVTGFAGNSYASSPSPFPQPAPSGVVKPKGNTATATVAPLAPPISMSNFNLGLQEAQDLLFKKKRGAALERLRGLRSFRLNSNQIRETQRLADSISTQFLTERGQQMFELAKTFMVKDPSEALSRLNEAKNEEPDNFVVLTWIGRTLLMKGDCEGAVDATEQPLRLFPTSQDIRLIRLQGLACLDKRKVLKTELQIEAADPSSSFGLYLELVKAQLAWFEGEYKTSLTHAEKARLLDPELPESYYWVAQNLTKLGRVEIDVYRKYVELCQKMTEAKRVRYAREPRTCLETASMTKALEKLETRGGT